MPHGMRDRIEAQCIEYSGDGNCRPFAECCRGDRLRRQQAKAQRTQHQKTSGAEQEQRRCHRHLRPDRFTNVDACDSVGQSGDDRQRNAGCCVPICGRQHHVCTISGCGRKKHDRSDHQAHAAACADADLISQYIASHDRSAANDGRKTDWYRNR